VTDVPWTDRRATALAMLGELYPPPLEVVFGHTDGDQRARFLAVPTLTRARVIVPAEDARVASRVLRRQLSGQRRRTRAARLGLGAVARIGALDHVPGAGLTVRGPATSPSLEDPLRRILQRDVVRLTMPVGPARANRKPVLQVSDDRGDVLAYAKVGHTDFTRELVEAEARTLSQLTTVPFSVVRPPRALELFAWRDLCVLLLEPLPTHARRLRGRAGRERLLAVVDEIARVHGVEVDRWDRHPLHIALERRLMDCGALAEPLLEVLRALPQDVAVPTGSWHGDLNPGNVALTQGRCPVWDWERYSPGVPVGFDLLHHDLQHAITVAGQDPGAAARSLIQDAPRLLAHWEIESSTARLIAQIYLLALAARYVADNQANQEADLGRGTDWIVPALQAVLPGSRR